MFKTETPNYCFGFNGMLRDDDIKEKYSTTTQTDGTGNSYSTEFRMYDPRVGRWLSLDPLALKFPSKSPFIRMGNNPIILKDSKGSVEGYFMAAVQAEHLGRAVEKNPDFTWVALAAPLIGAAPFFGELTAILGITGSTVSETIIGGAALLLKYDPDGSKTAETIMTFFDPNPSADYPGFADDIIRGAKSIWNMNKYDRGYKIEAFLISNLKNKLLYGFKVFDEFKNGVGTSIKSLDHTLDTYQNASKLKATLKGYVDDIINFTGDTRQGISILPEDLKEKILNLALLPENISPSQMNVINDIIDYGKKNNIQVNVQQIDLEVK